MSVPSDPRTLIKLKQFENSLNIQMGRLEALEKRETNTCNITQTNPTTFLSEIAQLKMRQNEIENTVTVLQKNLNAPKHVNCPHTERKSREKTQNQTHKKTEKKVSLKSQQVNINWPPDKM